MSTGSWWSILEFLAGGGLAGAFFLVLAYRAEKRASRDVDIRPPAVHNDRRVDVEGPPPPEGPPSIPD